MARIIGTIICSIVALAILLTCTALGLLMLLLIFRPPGDEGISPISEVNLPDSEFSVCLYGPDDEGNYDYIVYRDNFRRSFVSRSLGPVDVDQSALPTIKEEAEGIYRITWGSGPRAAFTVLDVSHKTYIEDANPENARNEPFKSMEEYYRERNSCSKSGSLYSDL